MKNPRRVKESSMFFLSIAILQVKFIQKMKNLEKKYVDYLYFGCRGPLHRGSSIYFNKSYLKYNIFVYISIEKDLFLSSLDMIIIWGIEEKTMI